MLHISYVSIWLESAEKDGHSNDQRSFELNLKCLMHLINF